MQVSTKQLDRHSVDDGDRGGDQKAVILIVRYEYQWVRVVTGWRSATTKRYLVVRYVEIWRSAGTKNPARWGRVLCSKEEMHDKLITSSPYSYNYWNA